MSPENKREIKQVLIDVREDDEVIIINKKAVSYGIALGIVGLIVGSVCTAAFCDDEKEGKGAVPTATAQIITSPPQYPIRERVVPTFPSPPQNPISPPLTPIVKPISPLQ